MEDINRKSKGEENIVHIKSENNKCLTEQKEIASEFNKVFSKSGQDLVNKIQTQKLKVVDQYK